MFALVHKLMGWSKGSEKLASTKRRPRTRLELEKLEDRMALSTLGASVASTAVDIGAINKISIGYSPFQVSGNTLNVYGTSGNDSFSFTAGTTSNTVTLNGASYSVNPSQIRNIYFYGGGGSDSTQLTDTLNKASATFSPHSATLSGSNYFVSVNGTMSNLAFGRSGDTASFYDSVGNDTFFAGKLSGGMYDSGMTYLNYATGFTYNNGYSSHGGKDTALFYDSPGNDTYFGGQGYAGMFDSADTYSNYATGFAYSHGYSSAGGRDTAYLFDSNAAGTSAGGTFVGQGSNASLFGYESSNTATGFADVEAYSSSDDYYTFYGTLNYTLHMQGSWEQE